MLHLCKISNNTMMPEERENHRYSTGSLNTIAEPELVMFSMLPEGNGKELLDIGCGIGTISLELEKKGFNVTGVDFSKVGIDKCLEKGLNAILSDVDEDGLKFPDKSFDVVWAGDVIEHVFDPIFLLEEISRVLKDNGIFLLTVPNNFSLRIRVKIALLGRSIQSDIYRKLRQCKHHTFFSWELLTYMLNHSKFFIDRYYSIIGRSKLAVRGHKKARVVSNTLIGKWFGRVFAVSARKLP